MRTYEELTGASGRQIYYRAERYRARDLFNQVAPEVEVDGALLALDDVSMTGLSACAGAAEPWQPEPGSEVSLRLRLDDEVLFEATARVCRTQPIPAGIKVGLGFTSGCLDISELVARHKDLAARSELHGWLRSDVDLVPAEYRMLVADALYFLRRYESVFERLSRKMNGHAVLAPSLASDVLAECETKAMPEWKEIWLRGNAAAMAIEHDPTVVRATKRFTEMVLTPAVGVAPFCRRAYEKPLGYAGDYELMNYVYSWQALGDTGFAKLIHRLGVRTAECVATRMVLARDAIVRMVERRRAAPGPLRVTSVGSGPAQEVQNVLEAGVPPRAVEFTLIDQDRDALSHAHSRIYPHTMHPGARASVQCLHTSFANLITDRKLYESLPPQDLIYSLGLVDYLTERRAARVVAKLYGRLEAGGELLVGSMRRCETSPLWPMEYLCDWSLNYRSEQEMWSMIEGLDAVDATLDVDPTGHVFMLSVRKP